MSDGSSTYLYGLGRIGQQNIVGRQYYFGDALGSVRQLINPAGTVTQACNFEPFGKSLSTAGNPLTKYGFTAEWTDPTNLIYLRARYYDPATGMFLSKDPLRGFIGLPQTINPYIYSVNNPILYVDPSGQIVIPLALAVVFGAIPLAGWVFIGAVGLGVFAYFAVPGVRENVTYGIAQTCENASNGLNSLFAKTKQKQKLQGTPLQTGGNTPNEKDSKSTGFNQGSGQGSH